MSQSRESLPLLNNNRSNSETNINQTSATTLHPQFRRAHSKISKGNSDLWVQRNLNTHLLAVIYQNNFDKVEILLQKGADPNTTCRTFKFTALHLAILTGSEEIVKLLIKKGANVKVIDGDGTTPLHYAAWQNRYSCINFLLDTLNDKEKNDFVNIRAQKQCPVVKEYCKDSLDHTCGDYISEFPMKIEAGATAMHVACQFIHNKCVEAILQHKPDISLKNDENFTCFEVLGERLEELCDKDVEQSFIKIIKMMQNNQFEHQTNAKINYFSPIHAAVMLCSVESINLLVKESKFSVDILDHYGQTPLHLAVLKQLETPLNALLGCVEDISNYKNSFGVTIFQTAVEQQWIEGVGILLNANVNVAEVAADGRTVLHVAATCGNDELLEELLELEEIEKILNAQNNLGETPIFCAVTSGNINCVKALLEKNVDINIRLNGNINILHRAAEYGNEGILAALLKVDDERKFNLMDDLDTLPHSSMTPFHMAALNNKVDCVMELLSWECDYKKKSLSSVSDYYGCMAIHLAARRGHENIVAALVEQDKDQLWVEDGKNRTVLHCAALNGQRNCIELLVSAGADLSTFYEGETALDIIYRNISRPTEFLDMVFDNAIKIDDKETLITDKNCMINIDFNILIPQNDKCNQMSILTNILFNGKGLDQKKLLLHPLIESFLYLKWSKMSKIFWAFLMLYAVFVCCLTTFVVSLFYYDDEKRPFLLSNIEILRFALIISLMSVIVPEILLIRQKLKQYTVNTDRCIKWSSVILVSILIVWVNSLSHDVAWLKHLATISLLTSWIEMMFMLSKIPTWGYYVQMFFKVSQNVIKVMTAFSFLIIGFALAFMIEFQTTEPFTNPLGGFIKTIVMMTAELEYSDLFTGENAKNADFVNLTIFVLFLMMGTIVLMNLLVGLAVSDIHDLEIIGKIDRHAQQIVFLSMLESDTLTRFMPKKYQTKMNEHKCVSNNLKVYPSHPKCSVLKLLPSKLKESIIDIAERHVQRESDISNIQLSLQIDELKQMIDELKAAVFNLTNTQVEQ